MSTTAPPFTLAAAAERLGSIHADLAALYAAADASSLPQGAVMSLHWLCEDALSTLAHMHAMLAPCQPAQTTAGAPCSN